MLQRLKRRAGRWIDYMCLSATARRIRAERLTYLPLRKLVRIESALAEAQCDATARPRRALSMASEGWEARVEEISLLILERMKAAA